VTVKTVADYRISLFSTVDGGHSSATGISVLQLLKHITRHNTEMTFGK